jgi:hypothetical protein
MNLFVLFGDGAITQKKKYIYNGNFASCATRNDMQFPDIFFSGDTPSPNKTKK